MIDFFFDKDEYILYVNRKGDIYLSDILNVIDKINTSVENCKHLYILQDTSESSMKYNMNDLDSMVRKFEEKLGDFHVVKIANYTNDPLETATAFIFEKLAKRLEKLHHKTFSTVEYAKKWLKKDMVIDKDCCCKKQLY